MKGKAEKKQQ